jgi:hypothetical protein
VTAAPHAGRRILLAATMRNEGPFILEWVAHHRAIGFTDILIASNDCVDGSPALLERLHRLGAITHLPVQPAPGEKPQLAAYAALERLPVVAEADWAMVLDADEFLNVHVGRGTVQDLIDVVPEATAFLINWRIFGNSDHQHWQPGPVTRRFTRAAPRAHGVNLSYKTLFTRIDAYGCKLMPHQPRYPVASRLTELIYVDGGGQVLPAYFHDESRDAFLQSEPGRVSWRLAQVNHYNTRSREDYVVKHRRGGGLDIAWELDDSWPVFNRNEETDTTISRHAAAADAVLADLLRDDTLRRLHENSCRLYGEHVRALTRPAGAGA